MRGLLAGYRRIYGSSPLHLLLMLAGFALALYVVVVITPAALWNPVVWSQSIVVWFAAAVLLHDLVLFPLYALADRMLNIPPFRPSQRPVSPLNYIRVPLLGAGLTLLVFLPGIIEQGAPAYLAATGQTQEPFLGRWLLLTAAMFGVSALAYLVRLAVELRRRRATMGG